MSQASFDKSLSSSPQVQPTSTLPKKSSTVLDTPDANPLLAFTAATTISTTNRQSATTTSSKVAPLALSDFQAHAILQSLPFAPNDVHLYRTGAYSTSTDYQPAAAPGTALTTSQLKSFVSTKMAQVYTAMNPTISQSTATSQAQAAANVINDPTLQQYVPDVRLRAAIAMLKGTAADGAIDVIKSGAFKEVYFVDLDPGILGLTGTRISDGVPVMQINSRYQNEDPRELASIISHEASHMDRIDSLPEEVINNSLESMVYGQFVLADATLPLQQTELTQRRNGLLMLRMNDRDANTGNLHLLSANGNTILPNASFTLATFASEFVVYDPSRLDPTTPGNA